MTHHLNSPLADIVGFIGSESDPTRRVWLVFGHGYTDSDFAAEWAASHGYIVDEIEEIPTDYVDAVRNLEAYPIQSKYGVPDGADPDAKFRFTGADGYTTVDVRDIINGTIHA